MSIHPENTKHQSQRCAAVVTALTPVVPQGPRRKPAASAVALWGGVQKALGTQLQCCRTIWLGFWGWPRSAPATPGSLPLVRFSNTCTFCR